MDKETLIQYAQELHQEAFDANVYFLIMQQYRQFYKIYKEAFQLSPAFYSVVYEALQKSCFMEIAKLYEKSNQVVTIGSLLTMCEENLSLFSEYQDTITVDNDGQSYSIPIPYQHQLKPEEERFFKSQVESQRAIFKVFNFPEPESTPVKIDLTFSEFLELYQKRFCSLSKKQAHVREQRNKIYAHNDKERIKNIDSVLKENPITYPDIQELIDFALDCTGLIFSVLSGEDTARQYKNIDDLDNTLWFAQLGLKYQEYDLKLSQEASRKEIERKLRGDENANL